VAVFTLSSLVRALADSAGPIAARVAESRGDRPQLDPVGVALVSAGLLALMWAPVRAPVRAPSVGWGDPQVAAALVVGTGLRILVRHGLAELVAGPQ
jgi:hypothetical protein